MKSDIFINQAFTNAITMYINAKQSNNNDDFFSFPVVIIRTLISIYGELDIINPFRTNNEERMGGFDANLTKFGLSSKKLQRFKEDFQNYYQAKQNQKFPNPYFLKIEKCLMDMFFLKKRSINITEEEFKNFQNLLYLSSNQNTIIQEELKRNINDIQNLDYYWQSKVFEINHNFQISTYKQNTLLPEAYNILGYSLEYISQIDEKTLEELNKQILAFFKINPEDAKKDERLKEAVSYYKQYGNSITTGNGYVDMLLLLSIIATIMMTLFAITVKALGG